MNINKISFNIIFLLIIHFFFSRVITNFIDIKFINLANIFIIPIFYFLYYWSFPQKGKIYFYMFIIISIISSILNLISFVNLFLYICILLYPYFIFSILNKLDLSESDVGLFEKMLLYFFFINLVLSYLQFFYFGIGDNVKGVFLNMGAGHHINGAVCLVYALHLSLKNFYKYIILITCSIFVIILSDSKQVILGVILGLFLMILFNLVKFFFMNKKNNNFKHFLISVFYLFILYILFVIIFNFELIYFNQYNLNSEYLVGGLIKKFQLFYYININDLLVFFFGNGPGTTVSKLAYMANYEDTYVNILKKFGFEFSNLALFLRDLQLLDWQTDFTSSGSSLFQMTFTFGGLLGDTGIFSLVTYVLLIKNIYIYNNKNFFNSLMLYTLVSLGMIFSWLEEPAFMFFILLICYLNFKPRDNS